MSHYKKGRFDRAVAEFEAAVEADPTYHWGHYNLACTLGIFHSRGYQSRLKGLSPRSGELT